MAGMVDQYFMNRNPHLFEPVPQQRRLAWWHNLISRSLNDKKWRRAGMHMRHYALIFNAVGRVYAVHRIRAQTMPDPP